MVCAPHRTHRQSERVDSDNNYWPCMGSHAHTHTHTCKLQFFLIFLMHEVYNSSCTRQMNTPALRTTTKLMTINKNCISNNVYNYSSIIDPPDTGPAEFGSMHTLYYPYTITSIQCWIMGSTLLLGSTHTHVCDTSSYSIHTYMINASVTPDIPGQAELVLVHVHLTTMIT